MAGKEPLTAVREIYKDKMLSDAGVEKWADHVLSKPQVRREIVRILDGVNLTKNHLALKLFQILHRPRGRDADKLKAIQMAFQMHGAFDPPEEAGQSGEYKAINMFIKIRQERGLEIPTQIVEAVKQMETVEAEVLPAELPTNQGSMETKKNG